MTATLLLLVTAVSLRARAEPAIDAKDLPRIPPTEPSEAIGTFEIKKGFRLELAACEPQVTSPVAIAFDERGRLFVVEMRDYPDRREDRMGRVRMLEDVDGDGVYEKATVYADGLSWPTGICCYDGGAWTTASTAPPPAMAAAWSAPGDRQPRSPWNSAAATSPSTPARLKSAPKAAAASMA